MLHLLGDVIGQAAWRLNRKGRRLALRNIELCYPLLSRTEQRRMAQQAFRHYVKSLLEYPLVWTGCPQRLQSLIVEIEGRELIDEALAQGKGLIIAAMHLGAFEVGIIPMSAHYPMTGMYKPIKNPQLDALSRHGRTRFGGKVIPIVKRQGKRAVGSDVLRALKRGEIIYTMPDRDPPRSHGVFAPYFGISTHSPVLIPRLVQATGARVLICTGRRLPRGRGFAVRFTEPPAGYDSQDLCEAVAALNAGIETSVRTMPDQYWWNYKRFKRRPYGECCFYNGKTQAQPPATEKPEISTLRAA
ncbi:lysophospholipid acyltransferase family protein [Solimonas sp. C16B3]|uniref:Lysophospholipid acyltransferase family protein n=1 Tax=Solimonas marina TaxID=2714601 RepID=A0A969W6G0_9GAMM|nr:lysophospholipid acyltransferase family protein [Solimonas marina]